MKKNTNKYIYITSLSIMLLSFAKFIFAVAQYHLLEPNAFPGISSTASLSDFLAQIFNFGIAAAVVLALIMIIWGGIEYMTADSWFKKDGGKAKVTDALLGLGLALISYLILFTINPCIVDFTGSSGCKNSFLGSSPSSSTKSAAVKKPVINTDPLFGADGTIGGPQIGTQAYTDALIKDAALKAGVKPDKNPNTCLPGQKLDILGKCSIF